MTNLSDAYTAYVQQATSDTLNGLLRAVTDYSRTVCRRMRLSPHDGEEVAQAVAISVWQTLAKYDPARASFTTWVHWRVRTEVSYHRRTGEQFQPELAEENSRCDGPTEAEWERIQTTRRMRDPIIEAMLDHGDVSKAAEAIGTTVAAARKRLKRLGKKITFRIFVHFLTNPAISK